MIEAEDTLRQVMGGFGFTPCARALRREMGNTMANADMQ